MNFTECFHGAEWVMPSEECNSPYFRDEFSIKSISKAELTVCGLGFYYPYINGRRVTEDLFITLATDYHEHFNVHGEEPAHRIICQKYDVTSFLHSGKNAIGFLVGGGYYRYRDDYSPVLYGRVRVCYYLEITAENGEKFNCVSGKNMKWFPSFVRECDNFLLGETHDYNSEKEHFSSPDFSAADWHNTEIAHIPETKYEYMTSPAVISLKEASGTMRLETGKLSVSYVRSESETAFVIQVPKGIRVRFEYMNFRKELSEGLHRFSC